MRVLVADDHAVTRFTLESLLRKWGFDVTSVDDGARAWEVLHDPDGPRLAILDWNMPGLSGMEVLERVRGDMSTDYTYIILLTARDEKEDLARGMEAGADDYIVKPFDARELRARLRAAKRILDLHEEVMSVQTSLMASQQELSAIIENSPIAMLLVDTHLRVRNANPAARTLSQRDLDEMLQEGPGKALNCVQALSSPKGCGNGPDCHCCQLRRIVQSAIATRRAQRRGEASLVLVDDRGNERQIHLNVTSAVFDIHHEPLVLICLEDITDRKAAEMELAMLNETLEWQVRQRTQEVEQLLRQKDEFVNQLGHDLKTPLTPLVALLPMLSKQCEDARTREIIKLASDNVHYMRQLVEKTLELARLNSADTPFDVEPVELLTETRDLLAALAPVLREKDIAVENRIVSSLRVAADPVYLREVFHNVISNAVKYTPEGGRLTIAAGPDAQQDGFVEISITDTGQGMTREQAERVFLEFYKADASRHDRGSVGLGLSICRRIVERHGGRIRATSPGPGQGTTVAFTLPAAGETPDPSAAGQGVARNGGEEAASPRPHTSGDPR